MSNGVTFGSKTITQLSKDDQSSISLVVSDVSAGDLDSWKNQVCQKYRGGNRLNSADAFFESDEKWVIEFKNQILSNIKRDEILCKAFDSISVLLFSKFSNACKDEFLKRTSFVLVYDDSRPDSFCKIKTGFAKYARVDSYFHDKIKIIGYHSVEIIGASSFLSLISA
ncbi:MAG: hypothetical protein IKP61_00235 [Spirochaetales bacterium]|nr:hypothetical protein [Spirochaetales bacterium]